MDANINFMPKIKYLQDKHTTMLFLIAKFYHLDKNKKIGDFM